MQRRFRLRRRRDFQAVLAAGRVFAGATLVGFARPSGDAEGPPRIGVSVSRRVRGAVPRNRARRRLREAARLHLVARLAPEGSAGATLGKTYDVVLIARPAALTAPFSELEREVLLMARRVGRAG